MFHELEQCCSMCICNFGHAVVSARMEEDSGGGEAVCDKLLARKRNRFLMCMPEMNYIKPEQHVNVRWKREPPPQDILLSNRQSKGLKLSFDNPNLTSWSEFVAFWAKPPLSSLRFIIANLWYVLANITFEILFPRLFYPLLSLLKVRGTRA